MSGRRSASPTRSARRPNCARSATMPAIGWRRGSSHVMVSRQETARPLLTPGEVMQLPSADELVLVSGLPPMRAKKLRYYEDRNFTKRVADAPHSFPSGVYEDKPAPRPDDWSGQVRDTDDRLMPSDEDGTRRGSLGEEGGLQQQRHPTAWRKKIPRSPSSRGSRIFRGLDATSPIPPPTSAPWISFRSRARLWRQRSAGAGERYPRRILIPRKHPHVIAFRRT